ncbi:sucrose-6-phosphate hydrolase [Geopyxis carbonaria]|nr:sucrose-6-phosphate hydrolase [Geopyxis carbonaria]
MRSFQALISAATLLASMAVAASNAKTVKMPDLDPAADLNAMGNNTLFNRWRPQYHFLAPAGWMNDPCGAVYDPSRDTYHLMYQWHTNHVQWGNISWGHAVSDDLVHWRDVRGWQDDRAVSLAPSEEYDRRSVFTGTIQPVNLTGGADGTLLAFYTAIKHLPTNWQKPYIPGTESQALATSTDGGLTWEKYGDNPVLASPPDGWNVTGWRDPFFEPWPAMDTLLGQEEPHYYMVMGSGIKGAGAGSRIPFYSAPASDLTSWTFLGALWEPTANETFGDINITGSYGFNFEVSNFFSLPDSDGTLHHFTTMGAEGGSIPAHNRWSLWSEGAVTRTANGSAAFDVLSSGVADWGNLYAITAFHDAKHDRRVAWGWSDEDMAQYGVTAQGFQGSLGLPRENFVHTTHHIVPEAGSPWTSKSSSTAALHENGTLSATTLGARPLPDVVAALHKRASAHHRVRRSAARELDVESAHFHLHATLHTAGRAGFTVRATPDGEEVTKIVYDPAAHRIFVDRSKSSLITQFANTTAEGYYYAPLLRDPESGEEEREALTFDVFVDGSLVEVFVNDRWALTTRVYPSRGDALGAGLWAEEKKGKKGSKEARFEDVEVWTGLGGVWPERPADSSSRLIYDSPEVTGDGEWWSGL